MNILILSYAIVILALVNVVSLIYGVASIDEIYKLTIVLVEILILIIKNDSNNLKLL